MRHWKELVRLSEEELSRLDVAEVNLACAAELPGAPTPFQVRQCIDRLNRYAKCVRRYTDERMPEFRAKPEVYDGSESVFRVVSLVRVVQGKFGVRYNPAKRPPDAPLETADTFIHGALVGEGGTCASLPVVFAAVGRRLGYPLEVGFDEVPPVLPLGRTGRRAFELPGKRRKHGRAAGRLLPNRPLSVGAG